MSHDPLVINVADLLRRPGGRRRLRTAVDARGLTLGGDTWVPDGTPVEVDVVLESLTDGVTVNGEVRTAWAGVCRRCADPASGPLVAEVQELYQASPTSEEAFPFDGQQLDLRPMVRELVLMELPAAPLCRDDCAGLCPVCGANRNMIQCACEANELDPRWSPLDALRQQLEAER